MWMLRRLQISKAKKIGLAALFLIAGLIVVFDILRTIFTVSTSLSR